MRKDASTEDLTNALKKARPGDITAILKEARGAFADENGGFEGYMRDIFQTRGVTQKDVFQRACIPRGYGYKLLSGEKHTNQRDTIIRILAASGATLEEAQRALKLYGLPVLYSKIKRDAVLIAAFGEGLTDPDEIDELLKSCGHAPLAPCGAEE